MVGGQGEHGNEVRESMGMRSGRTWEGGQGEHGNEVRESME